MHRALLVAHQDVAHLLLLEQGVIDREHRAARVAEQVLDALIHQGLDDHLGAGHFVCHVWLPIVSRWSWLGFVGNKKGPEGPDLRATWQRPLRVDAAVAPSLR